MDRQLEELLGTYFDAGVKEGGEVRTHDTEDSLAQKTLSAIRNRVADLIQVERQRCGLILTMNADELRLMAGEIAPGEMRTMQAILTALRNRIADGYVKPTLKQ